RRARVTQRSGAGLTHDDEVATRQHVADSERSGRHDGDDLAAERRAGLLRARQLRVDPSLPHDRVTAEAEEREDVLADLTERAHGASGADVVSIAALAAEGLRTLVADLDVTESEQRTHILQEASLLSHRLHQGQPDIGQSDAQSEPRKARPAAHVDHAFAAGPAPDGERGERVEEVLAGDVLRLGDRREVHRRIAFDELAGKPL